MSEERTIIMTRDSFCMGDDVTAPNKQIFKWHDTDWYPEIGFYEMIERYLGTNLPGFYWRGFAGHVRIVDVSIHRKGMKFTREIELVENWQELLRKNNHIHFLHEEHKNKDALPIKI